MKLLPFLKDKCLLMILHVTCMGMLSAFLRLTGYSRAGITLILIFWFLILTLWLAFTYLQRKKYFREIDRILDEIDQKYLLGELLPFSCRLEDRLYGELLRRSNKSVIERIRKTEDEKRDYKDYIESWVHEIKAPITGIALLCENGRKAGKSALEGADSRADRQMPMQEYSSGLLSSEVKGLLREISLENQKIENHVEMVLYYARMENVYKDFLIQKTDLQRIAEEVLGKNRLLLIQHRVRAEVSCKDMVYTDGKWISFILNQMVHNSVKYCSKSPEFLFYTRRKKDGVILIFEDNGVGILPEELSRIFEKGFTGSNGRNHDKATGMGLYLCKRLCGKLGIGLRAESEPGRGTKMIMEFPISNYVIRE